MTIYFKFIKTRSPGLANCLKCEAINKKTKDGFIVCDMLHVSECEGGYLKEIKNPTSEQIARGRPIKMI